MIFGSYRKDDFADPDSYLTQLAMVLERYDDAVIRAVTSPLTGIQRACKFPPSIAEFIEFIDEHIRRAGFAANYDTRSRKQLEEREQFEREGKTETSEHRKAVAERIKNELREHGFKFPEDRQLHNETPKTVMTKLSLTQEQWDAIPNAPASKNWQKPS